MLFWNLIHAHCCFNNLSYWHILDVTLCYNAYIISLVEQKNILLVNENLQGKNFLAVRATETSPYPLLHYMIAAWGVDYLTFTIEGWLWLTTGFHVFCGEVIYPLYNSSLHCIHLNR